MVLDLILLIISITLCVLDTNRFNYAVYLILVSIVTFCVLFTVLLARPNCRRCRGSRQDLNACQKIRKRLKFGGFRSLRRENPEYINDSKTDEKIILRIRGIPTLLQGRFKYYVVARVLLWDLHPLVCTVQGDKKFRTPPPFCSLPETRYIHVLYCTASCTIDPLYITPSYVILKSAANDKQPLGVICESYGFY